MSRFYPAGGAARSPARQGACEARSRLPVEVLDPFRRLQLDQNRFDMNFLRAHAAEAVVAVGLALRQPGDAS
jgi:type IV pilus assembly protein PilM